MRQLGGIANITKKTIRGIRRYIGLAGIVTFHFLMFMHQECRHITVIVPTENLHAYAFVSFGHRLYFFPEL